MAEKSLAAGALLVAGFRGYRLQCIYHDAAQLPPRNPMLIDIWFVIMAVCAVPQFVFSLFSVFGWCCMRLLHGHRNWGKLL